MPDRLAPYRSHAEIKAKLAAILARITGAGDVMSYQGQIPDWATDADTDGAPFWDIRRLSLQHTWPTSSVRAWEGTQVMELARYEMRCRYPFALDEANSYAAATEPTFEALVDAVMGEFDSSINLDGYVYQASPLTYDAGATGFVEIAVGEAYILCHEARFTTDITQYRTR